MAKRDAAPAEPVEARFGWDVVGEDGRRIGRWLSHAAAEDLAGRVAAAGEKVKLAPSDPRMLREGLTQEDAGTPEPEPEPDDDLVADA